MQDSRYFRCPTKEENVTATIEKIETTCLESPVREYEYGRFDCSGYDDTKCTKEGTCPLLKAQ